MTDWRPWEFCQPGHPRAKAISNEWQILPEKCYVGQGVSSQVAGQCSSVWLQVCKGRAMRLGACLGSLRGQTEFHLLSSEYKSGSVLSTHMY